MSQVDLDELRERIRELTNRVSRLEGSFAAAPVTAQSREPDPPAAAHQPAAIASVPNNHTSVLPVLGGGLLGLAGAYLLRAIAESSVLPPRAVCVVGSLYAIAWLWWAARAPMQRPVVATLYSLTSVMILSPLLWETTLRFHTITPTEASAILAAFTLVGLAASWQRNLLIVATISTVAGVVTAGALLAATHDVLPFTFVFLVIAAAVEACACLNHWLGERWLAAIAADLAVFFATWLVTNPRGLPEAYAPIPKTWLFAAQIALVGIYLASVIVRTLLRGLAFTNFETAQCALAFVIGLGGALRLAAGHPHISLRTGAFVLACAAACYGISFILLERQGSHGRNFFTYSTFAILLVLFGCRILFSGLGTAVVWSALAIVCTGTGGWWAKLTLQVHGGIYLALALLSSGSLAQSARFLLGTDAWPGISPIVLCGAAAVALLIYVQVMRYAPVTGDGWNFRALRLATASVLIWQALGVSTGALTGILHQFSGLSPGDPYCATLRTGAVTAAALLLAWVGRDFAQFVYPLMLLGGYRLVAVQLGQDHKASLFLSLLLFGVALIAIPRLRRVRTTA